MADEAPDYTEAGRKLFAGACDFIWAAAKAGDLPPGGPAEFAFAGRSNVGKSSLVNALTGRKTLARVSHTPGRTQQLNFFALGRNNPDDVERVRLVDMPGYGYAAVSKTKISSWDGLMKDYLRGRAKLLLDSTLLPMTEIAASAGFGSLRRFNAVFTEVYGRSPSEIRRLRPKPG